MGTWRYTHSTPYVSRGHAVLALAVLVPSRSLAVCVQGQPSVLTGRNGSLNIYRISLTILPHESDGS